MTQESQAAEFFLAPVELVIQDSTLPLAEVEPFATEYSVTFGSDVKITCRWGGPAAGGIGWGGPEIAVIIIAGELLRRTTSDAYAMLKQFVKDIYTKIRTRTGARWYVSGVFALGMDSESGKTRVLFCFPEAMSSRELDHRIGLVEAHGETVVKEWEKTGRGEVRVCWSEERAGWVECEPAPERFDLPPQTPL
ncbi:MAG: hypothetical protein HYY03_05560 [Chloroflexi bacterium]|nr:hypothetical protein [Chloroflexota bacterium]